MPFYLLFLWFYSFFPFLANLCLPTTFFSYFQLLLNDQRFITWEPIPYFWFAFHWLAMSHSCYNPVIYCYMNARFRGGFLQILHYVPCLRRCCCVSQCGRSTRNGSIGTGFALTGEMIDSLRADRFTRKPRIYIRCHFQNKTNGFL